MTIDRHALRNVIGAASQQADTFHTWESSVQFYLAAVAAVPRRSYEEPFNPGSAHELLSALRFGLQYPPSRDISDFATEEIEPTHLNRATVTKLGRQIGAALQGDFSLLPNIAN